MPIQSKKANDIQAYIDSHAKSKTGKIKVVIAGKAEMLESYFLPTSLLVFNRNNRRFALEIIEQENSLGRKLDPTHAEDTAIFKSLLLQDAPEAEKLKSDLKKIGEQTEVAAITHDGIVINGNRRMATLQELNVEEPTGKWENLWVVRLPADISQKDLWKIEAGLQLSKDKVAEYGPVNDLLMIREGKIAGLSNAEIAAAMYGWRIEEVDSAIERLNLIDTFLDFMSQPKQYGLIKRFRLSEHFINIQKGLLNRLKEEGAAKKEIQRKLQIAFGMIRASIEKKDVITHLEVRRLNKVMMDYDSYLALTDRVPEKGDIRSFPADQLFDNYNNAKEIFENKNDRDKPVKLIDKAITALKGIDRNADHYKNSSAVVNKLSELEAILGVLKQDFSGAHNGKH